MKYLKAVVVFVFLVVILVFPAISKPEYSSTTGQKCEVCHSNPSTGELNDVGKAYRVSKTWPPEKYADSRIFFIAGFIHMLSAFMWIGAILFVHVILSPETVTAGGAPKRELIYGWIGMISTGLSGAFLTYFKFRTIENLVSTDAGRIVLLKIGIFLFMLSTAIILTFNLNKKFKKFGSLPMKLDLNSLEKFDSLDKDERVLVSVGGLVYDFTESRAWKDGVHAGRHRAWRDLTEELAKSPHGIGVLSKFKPVGYTDDFEKKGKAELRAVVVFRAFAVLNLIFGVLAILLSSVMRWLL